VPFEGPGDITPAEFIELKRSHGGDPFPMSATFEVTDSKLLQASFTQTAACMIITFSHLSIVPYLPFHRLLGGT
jgi:hypothetical protein